MTTITFPVPSTTTSRFAVAAECVPDDLATVLHRLPAGPYQAHVTGRLGSPQLQLTHEEFPTLRWDPTHIRAAQPEHRRAAQTFANATEFAVVTAFSPITDQPRSVQVARAAANAIARATDGVAADLVTGRVLRTHAPERTRFVRLSDRKSVV